MPPASADPVTWGAAAEMLRSVFPRANAESIERLADSCTRLKVPLGPVAGRRSAGPELQLILEGHIAVVLEAPDGRVAFLGVFGPGSLHGLSHLDGDHELVGIEAMDEAVLATWPADRIRAVAESDPGLLLDLVDQLVERVRMAISLLGKQTFATASGRLASFLLRHEGLLHPESSPRIRRSQLAGLAGVSREMTGRILRRWERAGIIKRHGATRLEIVDRTRLEEEAAVADGLGPAPRLPNGVTA